MDVRMINPFIEAFYEIMPQLGFEQVKKSKVVAGNGCVEGNGVAMSISVVGQVTGNAVYSLKEDDARKIVSKMMMGMPVETLDEMAQSALSELSNMLTARASILFEKEGYMTNISVPTIVCGENFSMKIGTERHLEINMELDHDARMGIHILVK